MVTRAEVLVVKIIRVLAGVWLILLGKEFIEGGLSKYVPLGAPRTTHWGLLFIGLAILAAAATLIRPFWWREPARLGIFRRVK